LLVWQLQYCGSDVVSGNCREAWKCAVSDGVDRVSSAARRRTNVYE